MAPPDGAAEPDPRYVEARRVLLDALVALSEHAQSLTLVGAQAVYLRTGDADLAVAPYTLDGDLALDPRSLADDPRIERAMEAAGFHHRLVGDHPEPGNWLASVSAVGSTFQVPVDLIVPEGFASGGGRRDARLAGHGIGVARRSIGLEAALIDRDPMTITAFDKTDERSAQIGVAGVAALFVAKAHKIHDRVQNGKSGRMGDKDAADVVRMMRTAPVPTIATTISALLQHPQAGPPAGDAIDFLNELFGRRGGEGVRMATRALSLAMTQAEVEALCVAYTEALIGSIVRN